MKPVWLSGLALLAAACGSSGGNRPDPTPSPTPAPLSCGAGAPVAGTPALTATVIASGFAQPLDMQSNGVDCRLFVVEQQGRIRIVRDGAVLDPPFLDARSLTAPGGERGLLGLAFHPRYATNGRFYVNYTDKSGDTHISEFTANPPTSDTVDLATERPLLFVPQPFANHNGGGLAFGPKDGFLYIGLGDGGSGGDPFGNAQNRGVYLGKMLRIDVDNGKPYAIPSGNPFAADTKALPEIWAYGLRNPFRFSFDKESGDLLIGDVGQSAVEEIDLGLASRGGGEDYGWNITEGSACYSPSSSCDKTGLTLPIKEYGHGEGCSVIGGAVYRGRRLPGYQGTYFYSDYCSSFVRSFKVANGQASEALDWSATLGKTLHNVTAFGTDSAGEMYIVDQHGELYQIAPAP
jgi:glucose/arabinose dehydrogenase